MRQSSTDHTADGDTLTVAGTPAVETFLSRLTADAQMLPAQERRCEPRFALTMAVPTQALNEAHERIGESFVAITRSVSTRGVAFYFTKPVSEKLLAMQFRNHDGGTITAVLQVLRCESRGPLYEIAGTFVGRLAE